MDTKYKELCKPKLALLLEILKIDHVYTDASLSYLYTVRNGVRTPILDCVGGYGSTIIGHNPDILVKELQNALNNMTPVHAQGSIRKFAGHLAEIINDLIKRDLNINSKWIVHFVNTGTEATEGALKHALMEWQERKDNLQQKGEPLFVALKGGFHGKTSGSLAVTDSGLYSSMYQRPAVDCLFISPGDLVDELFEKHTNESGFCLIAGVIIEVIQGEGGAKPLEHDFVQSIYNACEKFGVMFIVDEVQSGVFRTGNFLAIKEYNIVPGCITLGKALGGGMAKIAAVIINSSKYCADFSIIHTSTFAEDDVSSLVACRTLKYLSCYNVHEVSDRFCKAIFAGLSAICQRYPGVIKDFRGKGFIIGVQFEEKINNKISIFMECLVKSGFYAAFISSYILNVHNIRTAATLNNSQTLRIEPAIIITESETNKLLLALEDAVSLLFAGRFLAMSAHIWAHEPKYRNSTVCSFVPDLEKTLYGVNQVVFLTHIIDKTTLTSVDPMFASLHDDDIEYFLATIAPLIKGYPYHRQTICAEGGNKVQLTLWGAPVDSRFFEKSLRTGSADAYKIVRQMAIDARQSGATHLGLGQFTSIVTNNGMFLSDIGIPVTTGNSLTVGSSFMSLKHHIQKLSDSSTLRRMTILKNHFCCTRIGIVGAAGNIGTVMAQLATDIANEVVVVHRELNSPKFNIMLQALKGKKVIASDNLDLLHTCDAVIICVNSAATLINAEHIKHGSVVLDVSIPSALGSSVTSRDDITIIYGGTIKLPLDQKLNHPGFDKFHNEVLACLAETIITGFTNESSSFSIGPVAVSNVVKSIELAKKFGFKPGRSSYMGSR